MNNNCMNCGAMLIGGQSVCPVCQQPVASSQANAGWQQPNMPPGASWQQHQIGPPPLAGGGDTGDNAAWLVGIALVLILIMGSVIGTIFFLKSRRASTSNNDNYNRRAQVYPTPYDEDSVTPPTTSSPGARTQPNRRAPISGGVLNGKATSLPKPVYPALARATRASGTVTVQVTIDESGKVTSARAISGHPLLKASAEQAARQARFTPTLLSGQPVKVTGVLTYNFTPEE